MAMDLPARHDRSSLNCRPGMLPCDTPISMVSVAATAAGLAGMIVAPGAMYVAFSFRSRFVAYRLCRGCCVSEMFEWVKMVTML